jgi:hypothetical protein
MVGQPVGVRRLMTMLRPLLLVGLLAWALASVQPASAAPPANDDIANATVVSSLPFTQSVSLDEATSESGEPSACTSASPSPKTVWFKYSAPGTTILMFSTVESRFGFFGTVAVYKGVPGSLEALEPCGSTIFHPQAGETYYVQVRGGGPLVFSLEEILPPANDAFGSPHPIPGLPFGDDRVIYAASSSPDDPGGPCAGTKSTWFTLTLPEATRVLLASNVLVSVYRGAAGALTEVVCGSPNVSFIAQPGQEYRIRLDTKNPAQVAATLVATKAVFESEISLELPSTTVTYGGRIRAAVHVEDVAGAELANRSVVLHAWWPGIKPVVVATGTLDGKGDVTLSFRPHRNMRVWAEWEGDVGYEGSFTRPIGVLVAARVTAKMLGGRQVGGVRVYRAGSRPGVLGRVQPAGSQLRFLLEVQTGKRWQRVTWRTFKADRYGRVLVVVTVPPGRYRIRTMYGGHSRIATGRSPWRVFVVKG